MRSHQRPVRSIGLWGHNGTGNLGNEATISAAIQNLRKLDPDIRFYGFSWDPVDTRERHGIVSFPIKRRDLVSSSRSASTESRQASYATWKARLKRFPIAYKWLRWVSTPLLELLFFVHACRAIGNIDLMLVAGTGQIADSFGGASHFPYSLFRWALYCRVRRVKWAVASVGAGPIDSPLSRRFIKSGLSSAVYRSFRDDYSRGLIEHLGVRGANKVFPDLVFSLDLAPYGMTNLPQEETKTVALTALPYQKPGTWERPCMQAHEHYLDSLTRFACWLLNQGYAVDLVPMQMPMDGELATDLRHRVEMTLPNKSARLSITCPNGTFEEVMHQFAMASVVVTMRFHGVILPYLLGKPVLALSVHPKINELMKEFEQTRFCIDIEALTFDTVVEKFKELESVKNAASKLILHRVAINKTLLEKQYRELLRL